MTKPIRRFLLSDSANKLELAAVCSLGGGTIAVFAISLAYDQPSLDLAVAVALFCLAAGRTLDPLQHLASPAPRVRPFPLQHAGLFLISTAAGVYFLHQTQATAYAVAATLIAGTIMILAHSFLSKRQQPQNPAGTGTNDGNAP